MDKTTYIMHVKLIRLSWQKAVPQAMYAPSKGVKGESGTMCREIEGASRELAAIEAHTYRCEWGSCKGRVGNPWGRRVWNSHCRTGHEQQDQHDQQSRHDQHDKHDRQARSGFPLAGFRLALHRFPTRRLWVPDSPFGVPDSPNFPLIRT